MPCLTFVAHHKVLKLKLIDFKEIFKIMVGAGGLEPPRTYVLRILSPVCLPIPPRWRAFTNSNA